MAKRRIAEGLLSGAVLLLALVPLLPPVAGPSAEMARLGEVAPRSVVADFDFPVLRDRSSFDRDLLRIKGRIPAFLSFVDSAEVRMRENLLSLRQEVATLRAIESRGGPDSVAIGVGRTAVMALLVGQRGSELLQLLDDIRAEIESRGYASADLARELAPFAEVTLLSESGPRSQPREEIFTPRTLEERLGFEARSRSLPEEPAMELARSLFLPNLAWEREVTERWMAEAGDRVARHRGFVLRGEKIVGAHEVVTPEVALALESYAFWRGDEVGEPGSPWPDRAGRLGIAALLLGLALVVTSHSGRPRHPGIVVGAGAVALLVTAGITRGLGLSSLLAPAAGLALFVSMFSGPVSGLLAGALFVTWIAVAGGVGWAAWVVLSSGVLASLTLAIDTPRDLVRLAGGAALAQTAAVLGLLGFGGIPATAWIGEGSAAFLGPILGATLAWASAGTVERLGRISSPLGTAELTSLDHPLLARLLTGAPGTHAHSMRVATLAHDAARGIGGRARLARAIGYHHDVGKLARPDEFPENGGPDPDPERARLLREMHLREGVALAEEARLPREIVRGIAEHHGVLDGVEGPIPTSVESAVVLLANRVERARRREVADLPARVAELIEESARSGELDESGLTLGDLGRIRERFLEMVSQWDRKPDGGEG